MTMSDQIIAVLDNICAKFGIVIDWTSENVIPYAKEFAGRYIRYEIATSVVSSIMILAILFALFKCVQFACKKCKEDPYSCWDLLAIVLIICFVITFIAAVCIVYNGVFSIVTCITFPEKAIFEYVNAMMR